MATALGHLRPRASARMSRRGSTRQILTGAVGGHVEAAGVVDGEAVEGGGPGERAAPGRLVCSHYSLLSVSGSGLRRLAPIPAARFSRAAFVPAIWGRLLTTALRTGVAARRQ
jgi:hypothetical protein